MCQDQQCQRIWTLTRRLPRGHNKEMAEISASIMLILSCSIVYFLCEWRKGERGGGSAMDTVYCPAMAAPCLSTLSFTSNQLKTKKYNHLGLIDRWKCGLVLGCPSGQRVLGKERRMKYSESPVRVVNHLRLEFIVILFSFIKHSHGNLHLSPIYWHPNQHHPA